LALATTAGGRRLGRADLPVAEDLAARIAVAVDNARSHRARVHLAQTLQRSLLPPALPCIEGIRLAARYHPVRGGGEVGGDFYDVFPLGDGRWGAVIGDVCGSGALAASLTALVRYTVRAEARRGDPPSLVLQNLHRAVLEQDLGERFCTVALAYLQPRAAAVEVTVSCAGHPLPLLSGPEGPIRPVGRPGSAIGLVERAEFSDTSELVIGGQVLAFYTDGVIEARDSEGRLDDRLLEAALARSAGQGLEAVAQAIEGDVLAHYGGVPRDDVAFLLVSPEVSPEHRGRPSG
ncbi:MAG: serine/threonine-protein phosphatase, partial [Actinomycetota bacterium]|nr:serine/threonine-protein phosphatase [Actinomycetota bacterium]